MKGIQRRDLLKLGVLGGGAALLGKEAAEALQAKAASVPGSYPLQEAENTLYSVCLQCNTGCPIKVKLYQGVAAKIDGNPITPWTMYPHLPYKTDLKGMAHVDGSLCPKGQSGIQSVYDPYRIRKVLKRAGPRGSGKWVEIPFEQAIQEIVEGGQTFASIGDNRNYPGLKDYWALRDPKVMKAMSKAVDAIWAEKDKTKKKALVEQFKLDFKDYLDTLIDPDHPDLGPKNNQVVFSWGRLKGGRTDFFKWFFDASFGTVNLHGHTTVCQGSLYFTGKAMSEQLDYDEKKGKFDWTGGKKFYWQGDLSGAEFAIFVGSNVYEGGYGPPLRVNRITQAVTEGKLRFVVIDPRAQKAVAHAARWIAPKPGTDAAIAMGMIRWILEQGRYDAKYLSAANKAAAVAAGEPTWSNAAWLVKLDDKGFPAKLLRASDLGLPPLNKAIKEGTAEFDAPIALVKGVPTRIDPQSEETPVVGDLFVDTTLAGLRVKSVLQLIREEAGKESLEGWAKIAGIQPEDIAWLAFEFTSHGKRAAIDIHRGVSQHTNGFYNVLAWYTLGALIGSHDWQGGLVQTSTYDALGEKAEGPFFFKELHPKKLSPFGISIIRHGIKYENTTLFEGYPAKRPWYYNASDVYQEVLPSAAQGYPYPVKILFHYMGSPAYALPAGHTQIQAMLDPDKIGLIVASDIVVGETYAYADYVFPDLSYLERWEFHGSHPNVIWKTQSLRQPTIPPIPETVKVFGEEIPLSMEAMLMALAEKMGMPGFGEQGFAGGMPFKRPEDFYLKMVANLAYGEAKDGSKAVPEADDAELELFAKARRHLPKSVFDPEAWKAAVGEAHWRRVVYVMNRGGRFEDFKKAFAEDGTVAHKYGKQVNLYLEKQAGAKDAMTGRHYYPIAAYFPAYLDATGQPIADAQQGYELNLITHRIITMTKSRTVSNYWLLNVQPENFIAVPTEDAKRLGLRDGQQVKVVSMSNPEGVWELGNGQKKPMIGKVKVVPGLRPGSVAFSLGYGHWGYGATDVMINGKVVPGDPRRATGIHANAAMRVDPVLKDVTLSDLTGGSAVFYDTKVRLEPVG